MPDTPSQTRLQRLKLSVALKFFRAIDLMHAPLVEKAQDDPYHHVFARFRELGSAIEAPAVL